MLVLLLLPSPALAQNRDAHWGNGRWAANNRYNQAYRNGAWGNRNGTWGNRGGWGYRNNGYYGNPNYGQGGYWGYGDRDYWRHRHYRHRWYGDGDGDDDGGWGNNGRWNGNTPPGWQHGRKRGWGDSGLPPGQAKKQGWW